MGMNYYAVKPIIEVIRCPHCGQPVEARRLKEEIHIGKSSFGWLFLFHESDHFWSFPTFIDFINNHVHTGEYVIQDEYGEIIPPQTLIDLINFKQTNEFDKSNPDNFTHCDNRDGYRFTTRDFS